MTSIALPSRVTCRLTGIEHHAVDLHAAAVRLGFGAAQNGFYAGRKLARIEWLRKVIVGPELQADNAVDVLAASGQHQHWNPALGAKSLEDLEAVQAGQHYIQNNKVVAALLGVIQASLAIVDALDREAFPLQKLFQKPAEFDVIVDDQQPHPVLS